ncbi:transcriptional regulator [Peptoclostridium acidaminophilum]|uniref:transcriptional regulator n=1 Tax=Peptoclostridium acidaminophilum TaxID=1731 RepID=UPI00046CF64B|nr:transcriptional regulator [Peptoclostridium acidaminophilum]
MDFKLTSTEEKILAYLRSKEINTGYSDVDSNEISNFLEASRSSTSKYLSSLRDKKLLIAKQEGKRTKYLITSEGRNYLEVFSITLIPARPASYCQRLIRKNI